MNILLIDDSFVTRLKVKNILMNVHPFNFDESCDGEEGLNKINSNDYDLILLDLLMPKKDGFEVLNELKIKGFTTPVIVLSADIQNTTKQRCLELGAHSVVPKSVDLKELIESVKGIVQA